MGSCGTPTSISGGVIITSEPYANASYAVYQCNSGYVMSGESYIECLNGVWGTTLPSCTLQDYNNLYNYITENHDDIPNWLFYMFAGVCGLVMLLLLTCILVWCLQCMGCYGKGAMFGEMEPSGSPCCCCSRRKSYQPQRRCNTFPRRFEYDEDGRRYHVDDYGYRCYYPHKGKHSSKVAVDVTSETHSSPRQTFVNAVSDVMYEKRGVPAKEVQAWKPHANPVRNINTSTK
ncbi:uncharacterized protein LOC128218389 [Mya arenaria]|uniref:uncharacterized protein LOC128218389 n=1 Tax=Mya arenaria TaxID=6604 RepID=UPI0022DF2F43|nr:uncharacterized protein LOC128218389 [Mya arenaria]XP_052782009.1 uncharacterized protein LOC128218389 [Mya arenaria]